MRREIHHKANARGDRKIGQPSLRCFIGLSLARGRVSFFARILSIFPRVNFILKIFRRAGSLRITCVLLAAAMVLLFWGTLFAARAGADAAASRFFGSWFVWVLRIVPLPALKMLSVILSVNLISAILFRIPRKLSSAGLYVIHGSLLFLIAGSFAGGLFRSVSDAYVLSGAGVQGKNEFHDVLETGSFEFELADTVSRPVNSFAADSFTLGAYSVVVDQFCENAEFDLVDDPGEELPKNRIGFPAKMTCVTPGDEPRPGALLRVRHSGWNEEERVLLSAMDESPFTLAGGETLRLSVRRHRLPFSVKVLAADSLGADVRIEERGENYRQRIALNAPFKRAPYAVYFSGVSPVGMDVLLVRFSVRQDAFAFVPYVFSALLFAGLLLHFGAALFRKVRR